MSEIGEILIDKNFAKHIWQACEVCGKERWVKLLKGKPRVSLCHLCAARTEKRKAKYRINTLGERGNKNRNWRGGRIKRDDGYILILLQPDNFFYSMANRRGYVMEHRLVVAKRLGRCLLKSERVHHIDGIKDHNEDSNLQLISQSDHILRTTLCKECELRKEIRLLRLQNQILLEQVREIHIKLMETKSNVL